MLDELPAAKLYEKFRLLAVTDPKEARVFFNSLLDTCDSRIDHLLEAMSEPAEGRVRQLVANAVRGHPNKEMLLSHLLRWQSFESDEFAKRAIDVTLQGLDSPTLANVSGAQRKGTDDDLASKETIEIYRWIAKRLCHRVRNAMTDPVSNLAQLERLTRKLDVPMQAAEVLSEINQLRVALTRISRIVEFDIADSYFSWKEISIWPWLRNMAAEYGRRYDPIELNIIGEGSQIDVKIKGNELLLETVFWNLWKDSAEAIGKGCRVEICANIEPAMVNLTISDNGAGFTLAQSVEAFRGSISTKGPNRGLGLLEVAEAVGRLHGTASIVRVNDGSYRVKLSFPRV